MSYILAVASFHSAVFPDVPCRIQEMAMSILGVYAHNVATLWAGCVHVYDKYYDTITCKYNV